MNVVQKYIQGSENENGVTIIEILMAIAIVAVGILAVVAMQTASARGNATSSDSTGALILAVDQMEQLMDQAWSSAALDPANNTQQVPSGQYTIEWDVTNGGVFNDTKTIDMTVRWSSWGAQRFITIQQVIPRII